MQLGDLGSAVSSPSRSGRSLATNNKELKKLLSAISNIAYFSDRGCVHTLHTLYVYAADSQYTDRLRAVRLAVKPICQSLLLSDIASAHSSGQQRRQKSEISYFENLVRMERSTDEASACLPAERLVARIKNSNNERRDQ